MNFPRISGLGALLVVLLALLALVPRADADAAGDLGRALKLAQKGDWAGAQAAAGAAGSLGRDIVDWLRLRDADSGAGFSAYRAFVARHPDWPGMPYLMKMGERAIGDADEAKGVAAWFAIEPPQTGAGVLQAVRAYRALGQDGDAEVEAVLAWRTMVLSEAEEASLLEMFPKELAAQHVARVDMLLWQGQVTAASRLLPRLPAGWQKLAAARIALRKDETGVDGLIAQVPATLAADPGLAWERYLWRKRRGRTEDAAALMLERSTSAEALGRPGRWAGERRSLARQLMREGKASLAYRVASRHFLGSGDEDYADLEWLSGYLALRFLHRPADALEHFTRFRMAVATPISLGRAGYWEGRALEAMGAKRDAQAAYEFGAGFQTSFYGMLAAEKAGKTLDPALLGKESVPDWHGAAFLSSSVAQAGLLALKAGDLGLAARFLRHLAERLDATGLAQLADMGADLGAPHLALKIAKYAAERGIVLDRPYYPLHPLARADLPVPPELALAVARRESEFDPVVVSAAGARGLMQLMPATAKEVAGKLGVDYEPGRLLSDPLYNARLGSAYLAQLIERYGHNWMMVAAAYNAGPSRPARWVQDYGDPRAGGIDPVDWIEMLPFEETRNYVMRVTEAIPIYRARLSGKTGPITLSEDLKAR